MKRYWRLGEPWVWLSGAALTATLLAAATLLVVIMVNGLGVFWPGAEARLTLKDGSKIFGEVVQRGEKPDGGERLQLSTGNRDLYGLDFRWIDSADVALIDYPGDALIVERTEYGNFHGFLRQLNGSAAVTSEQLHLELNQLRQARSVVADLEEEMNELSGASESNRLKIRKREFAGKRDAADYQLLQQRQNELDRQFQQVQGRHSEAIADLRTSVAVFADAAGTTREVTLADIVRVYAPNAMSLPAKVGHYLSKIWELLSDEPRESNTEGGLFPAIFGTVMLIFLMSAFSFPVGVLAGIYLREYARDGFFVRLVRIAVNNLAGIPSIVYGIFGLGFFVYGIGGGIDRFFFPESLPTPTFGTGGILWASLTLALLTVPVVIVATEEALGAIPGDIRAGSLALGATKLQTLMRILLPMASPGIMTGFILAMARAAGEVAPLMITGVVKLAPSLPLDGSFPFLHLDRKFMHLGFHIYDIGFQSPNVEAAKPMVYVTTLLLVLIVLVMNSIAIRLRNRMKKRYSYGTF
ncbi:MAG: phosphate ABC transporter, permease protein PstA [Desulfuromonadales bacterium GWD2_61_12]|nr:MAG: phosphate ABC transporter, permease protein PstA [Desulfuromonadales bacterium GWC2_61_20]OGR35484.1 MAG: phosphate ABC transporter, permease protein PstA [Desulfuromonadales bacterium GWD2_61_12]HAD05214.1 phosphate ABC transporter permease PtsA [Desulfuromonas sp.]HBT84033.1 phosphate ABC transporter permease PtsA [Desulfuromonas sp.]